MKKIFLILLVVTLGMAKGNAQIVMTQTDPAGAAATVNTNADTSYHQTDLAGNINNFDLITIAVKGTKTSGTVAGAVTLWVSMDNSRWYAYYGKTVASTADTTHSISLTDGDVNFFYELDKTKWRYYRVRVITSGTQVSSYTCRLMGRKIPN